MSQETKFYVSSEEFWGQRRGWFVADRVAGKRSSKHFRSEAQARAMCARMEADWERYQTAMWARPHKKEA